MQPGASMVKRYKPVADAVLATVTAYNAAHPEGDYVTWKDYDALAARCAELTDLLSRCSTDCNQLSHRLGEYHEYDEACPVAMKIERALTTRADE